MAEGFVNQDSTVSKKIPVYLVTGFLGSGKTTFIKEVINTFSGTSGIAVVQNEFAAANIDGLELKRLTNKHFDILEINNGSVFCVCLLSDFVVSLRKFADKYNPGLILLEASGLSDPVSVGEIFGSKELKDILFLAGLICIVDAVNYEKLNKVQQRLRHQVMIADTIIINKTDLSRDPELLVSLNKLNPFAKKFMTSFCKAPFLEIFKTDDPNHKPKKSHVFFPIQNSERPWIYSAVLRTAKPLKESDLPEFLKSISRKVYRLKGYIILNNGRSVSVQTVYNEIHSEVIQNHIGQTELISLSDDTDPKFLQEIYLKYT